MNAAGGHWRRWPALACEGDALTAGALAISLNVGALSAADRLHLPTSHGGLLNLATRSGAWVLRIAGADTWASVLARPASPGEQIAFHVGVGLLIALAYGLVFEPRLSGPSWLRGLEVAAPVWLINALVVLPLTGQGVAGAARLPLAGLIWYAAAHTLFFVVLAISYARLRATKDA